MGKVMPVQFASLKTVAGAILSDRKGRKE